MYKRFNIVNRSQGRGVQENVPVDNESISTAALHCMIYLPATLTPTHPMYGRLNTSLPHTDSADHIRRLSTPANHEQIRALA